MPIVNAAGDGYELGEVAVDAYTKAESDARYAPIAAAIRPTVTGETISVNDSVEWPLQGLALYGKSTQDGTPTPEAPIPIVSAGDGGTITVTVSDGAEQSQTLPISTPNGLPGIPVTSGGNYTDADGQQWVCDEVDLQGGKYIQHVDKFVFSNALYAQKETNGFGFRSYPDGNSGSPYGISNCGKIVDLEGEKNYGNIYIQPSGWTIVYDPDFSHWADVSDFKAWANNKLTIFYALKNAIETDLTPEQLQAYATIKTYAPSTTIQTDSTPAAGLAVRYVADAQKYIDGKLSAINTQLLEVKTNV